MKKIIVVAAPNGMYLVTVTGGRQDQGPGFGSIPKSYSAKGLPQTLIGLGVDQLSASNAAPEVDKHGSWIMDITA
jgi:hypothetical protein